MQRNGSDTGEGGKAECRETCMELKRRRRGDDGQEKQETEMRERGEKERKGVERYTSPCPCKVLRAVEAAAKNVSAQPSHAA